MRKIQVTKRKIILFIFICIMIIMISPLKYAITSYGVMYFYSMYEENKSIMKEEKIDFTIPGGLSTFERDWYPFMIVFNDSPGFSWFMKRPMELSILYDFGHFEYTQGASSYYNPNSEYFNGFYGGYIVKEGEKRQRPFGFHIDGEPILDELTAVPRYDLRYLVLQSLGCKDVMIESSIDRVRQNIKKAGYEGWTRIDATIRTNSPLHKKTNYQRAYIQYGAPPSAYYSGENFPIIFVKGRIYARYFEQWDATLFLYVIASDEGTIDQCDMEMLSGAKIQ